MTIEELTTSISSLLTMEDTPTVREGINALFEDLKKDYTQFSETVATNTKLEEANKLLTSANNKLWLKQSELILDENGKKKTVTESDEDAEDEDNKDESKSPTEKLFDEKGRLF